MMDPIKKQAYFDEFERRGYAKEAKADPNFIRIVSSNVLHSHDPHSREEGVPHFSERMEILAALYLYLEPDFIGLQEVSYEQQPILFDLLSEKYICPPVELGDYVNYKRYSPPYAGIRAKQNHTPTLYHKERYEVVDTRYHLMDVGGLHSYHWGIYRSLANPEQKYIHMNLHFCPYGDERQVPGILDARNEVIHLQRLYPTTPLFVTGDYNMMIHWDHFKLFLDGLNMQTGMLIAEQNDGIIASNHKINDPTLDTTRTAIDHISITTELCVAKRHRIVMDDLLCKSTDHCPTYLDVEIK